MIAAGNLTGEALEFYQRFGVHRPDVQIDATGKVATFTWHFTPKPWPAAYIMKLWDRRATARAVHEWRMRIAAADMAVAVAENVHTGSACKYCGRVFAREDLPETVWAGEHERGFLACKTCWAENNGKQAQAKA